MNTTNDPERWSDDANDAPAALQRMLQNARDDVPGPRALGALGIAVPALISQGSAVATAGANAAGAAKVGAAVKAGGLAASAKLATAVVVGAIIGSAVVGSGYFFANSKEAAPPAPPAVQAPNHEASPAEVKPEASIETIPAIPSDDATTTRVPVEASPRPAAAGENPAKPTVEELPLLQRARSLLGSDPSKALSLVRRHEQEFPRSQYTQEREVIRIEALRALGRDDEADRLGADFNRRFPGSAHKSKLNRESQ